MSFEVFQSAVAQVPAGRWAVGVSGGADSVALLRLAAVRADLALHVVHLNHQLRGRESDDDAGFVSSLARSLGLEATIVVASQLQPPADLPTNIEARGRAMRFGLFGEVVAREGLAGVILAHHADDQAETLLFRLLRGSLWWSLRGMSAVSQREGLVILRPLLKLRRELLRQYLESIKQAWREDASNQCGDFARNRIRALLHQNPRLVDPSVAVADACDRLCDWIDGTAPELPAYFSTAELGRRPVVLARLAATRWLVGHGCPPTDASTETADRLIEMCRDAATPARQHFPGGLEVRRQRGVISVTRA